MVLFLTLDKAFLLMSLNLIMKENEPEVNFSRNVNTVAIRILTCISVNI